MQQLIHELKDKEIFGRPVALVYTIEFQQRGLPHMHLLLTLDPAAKLSTNDLIDRAISAELPMKRATALPQTVSTCLIHTPFGIMNVTLHACETAGAQSIIRRTIATPPSGTREICIQPIDAVSLHTTSHGYRNHTQVVE